MKKTIIFALIFTALFIQESSAQFNFLGFEQEQCGLLTNHPYSYQNIPMMCGSHSSGYEIYYDGTKVYEKCIEFGGCTVIDLMVVSNTTAFLLERNPDGHKVYKTENSGAAWTSLGGGAPNYLGLFLIGDHAAYLVTCWDNPLGLYITRVSDIETRYITDPYVLEDTIIDDSIWGPAYCDYDTLGFSIEYGSDIIRYQLAMFYEASRVDDPQSTVRPDFYPNPASDYIRFSNTIASGLNIRIFDLSAALIKSVAEVNDDFYVGDLPQGIYLLEISSGEERTISKLIIH